jgi:multimeric flavodoxin WrbA
MVDLSQSKFIRILKEYDVANNESVYEGKVAALVSYLKKREKVLFLTTSNRWEGDKEKPKSTQLAEYIAEELGNAQVIDVSKLTIYCCEGNVSRIEGNNCGVKDALLKDKEKNPTGYHRCWASLNNKDDELWKVSKPLFESDAVVFFASVRWGQANSIYQKLIERLDWIENRHTTLKEDSIIEGKVAGIIAIGQNWNGKNVIETQKQVLEFYGFEVPDVLSFNWQYTQDALDESQESYKKAPKAFEENFGVTLQ